LHHIVRNHKNAALEELLFSGIKVTGDRVRVSMDRGIGKEIRTRTRTRTRWGRISARRYAKTREPTESSSEASHR